ncbi:MAG: FAD-binding oxidoreductase [Myxococcales bacterium]|nr:FAD-binding oxidoreductase [Myxococcales bacterium]
MRATRGAELAPALRSLTAPDRVSTTPPDRLAYARDLWPRGMLGLKTGQAPAHPPDVVVWPTSTAEVQAIVRLAVENRVPIVPFGAGSGVCGGTLPLAGGMVVDLKRMRRLVNLDRASLTATFEAGILGEHLEHELARRGYTLGHFPSSIMCSTLGGWLAARSAGQCSTRYGKIEDMVRSVELVTGTGEVIDTTGSHGLGADFDQLLIGSEGTLGIFTRAVVAIRPAPEARILRGFSMPRVAAGCEAIRRVMQRGLRPSVVRLYDEIDTLMARSSAAKEEKAAAESEDPEERAVAGWLGLLGSEQGKRMRDGLRRRLVGAALGASVGRMRVLNRAADALLPRLSGGCLLIVGCEGDRPLAEAEARATFREIERAGGKDLGPGPGERWLRHRYDVSFKLSKMFQAGAFADTMEVAVSWDRLLDLYRAVREALAPLCFVMAHFSHAYADGCSIYFSFAAAAGDDQALAEERYDAIWRTALAASTSVGATISHHHGVGLSKAAYMPAEHGESMAIFRALKRVLDPHGILNPGKMGL